jgi:hypothetical protein
LVPDAAHEDREVAGEETGYGLGCGEELLGTTHDESFVETVETLQTEQEIEYSEECDSYPSFAEQVEQTTCD